MAETRSLAYGWYHRKEGSPAGLQTGPLSWGQLYTYAQNGTIGPNDLVWNIELPEWLPASQVPGLTGERQPAGTAAPAPTLLLPSVPSPPQRSASVLAWLLPVVALIIVGAGFGIYFGLLHDGSSGAGIAQASLDPVVVTAADGATVTFPAFGGTPGPDATLTQVTAPSGQIVDDSQVVSGEYALRANDASALSGDVIVALPLATDLLPAGWDPAGLTPEALDPVSGQWEPVGRVVDYDETTQRVMFDVPYASYAAGSRVALAPAVSPPTSAQVAVGRYPPRRAPATALASGSTQSRYRIRLHFMSNWMTYVPAGDHKFEVTYYPISGVSYSVRKDADWPSSNPWVSLPKVPDYVEDLSHALETGYAGLLEIRQFTAALTLFRQMDGAQEVLVTNTGAVEGSTSLFWGTVKISNSRLGSYKELEQVATHELTHLLCDQYYTGGGAATNRWFFEAAAEYLAARARGLSEAERGLHYASPSVVADVYLSIPLTTSDVSSYYAAAHFLDWCSKRYGASLVPTVIVDGSDHPSSRDDVAEFSRALELHGEPGGIGAAYGAYVRALMSAPEDFGGANRTFKSNVTTYASKQQHASATDFDEYTTYIKLTRALPPLSTTGVYLQGRNSDNALLVIDGSGSTGGALQSAAYDFVATNNAAYQSAVAIDAGLGFPYPQTLTVADFGRMDSLDSRKKQLEQLIANTSTTQTAQVEVVYYLLRPPPVTEVEDGAVTWSTAKLGNMPKDLIHGYHVYKDGVRLTASPVPVPADGLRQRFESDQINAGDTLVVQVVDRAGNKWPLVAASPEASTTTTSAPTTTTAPPVTVTVPTSLTDLTLRAALEDAGVTVITLEYHPDYFNIYNGSGCEAWEVGFNYQGEGGVVTIYGLQTPKQVSDSLGSPFFKGSVLPIYDLSGREVVPRISLFKVTINGVAGSGSTASATVGNVSYTSTGVWWTRDRYLVVSYLAQSQKTNVLLLVDEIVDRVLSGRN